VGAKEASTSKDIGGKLSGADPNESTSRILGQVMVDFRFLGQIMLDFLESDSRRETER
jgi:hypothetical protein